MMKFHMYVCIILSLAVYSQQNHVISQIGHFVHVYRPIDILAKTTFISEACLESMGTTSSVVGLVPFITDFMNEDEFKEATLANVLTQLRHVSVKWKKSITLLLDSIYKLPKIIDYMQEERNLIRHFSTVAEIFRLTSRKQKQINNGLKENAELIQLFITEFDPILEESMTEIRRIFLGKNITTFLINNYQSDIVKFANVCTTKMSQLQLLDYLLGSVKVAYSFYYQSKRIAYNLRKLDNKKMNTETSLEFLRNNIVSDFNAIVVEFKSLMATASREFWTCDTHLYKDDARYENNEVVGAPYYELRQFSVYFSENYGGSTCNKNTYSTTCLDNSETSLCKLTRKCPIEFLKCDRLMPENEGKAYQTHMRDKVDLCVDNNSTAVARYRSVMHDYKYKYERRCTGNSTYRYLHNEDENYQFCECLCHERKYYFDDSYSFSWYAGNRIVTGARFVVEDDIISIQIQDAEVLQYGIINKTTLNWSKRNYKQNLNKNQKLHTLEAIDLTEIEDLPPNKVVVGVKFHQSPKTKRIQLKILAMEYDFISGKLSGKEEEILPPDATEEYSMKNRDVPTKAPKTNKPDSKKNQFFKFSVTDKLKDGGQTTIPFIDTQNVAQPMPLSRISFYIRGQPGYGGFLALKLTTFNIVPFIESTSDSTSI